MYKKVSGLIIFVCIILKSIIFYLNYWSNVICKYG